MTEATAPDVEAIMNDYFAVRKGDQSKLDVLSDSFTFHAPGLPDEGLQGSDELLEWQRANGETLPDGELTVDDVLVGDDFALWKWTLTGTHLGEFQDIPPTGREIRIEGMSKTVIEDGEVAENRAYFDFQDLLAQLGAADV